MGTRVSIILISIRFVEHFAGSIYTVELVACSLYTVEHVAGSLRTVESAAGPAARAAAGASAGTRDIIRLDNAWVADYLAAASRERSV